MQSMVDEMTTDELARNFPEKKRRLSNEDRLFIQSQMATFMPAEFALNFPEERAAPGGEKKRRLS